MHASTMPWHDGHAQPHPAHPLLLLPAAHANHPDLGPCNPIFSGSSSPDVSVGFTSPDGIYFEGDTIGIRANGTSDIGSWSQGRAPHSFLQLETGTTDRPAIFDMGYWNSPIHINYTYTVQEGDLSKDLDYVSTDSLHWRANAVSNLLNDAGDTYDCRLPFPGTAGSLSDRGNITVIGAEKISSYVRAVTPNGTYGEGSVITVAVEFDEPVSYSGSAPQLRLNASGLPLDAEFWDGDNTDTFRFNYTVQSGDNTDSLGYYGTNALSGNIVNSMSSSVDLTLPSIDTLAFLGGIAVDTPAAAARVSSPNATRAYGAGSTIHVAVTFTDSVVASGTPLLELETGAIDRNATYVPELSGGPSLVFNYTVRQGDASPGLDYTGASALSLNGGYVRDAASSAPAGLVLPEPGGAFSLAGTSDITIETVRPEVESVSSPNATRAYGAGETITVNVTFSERVTVSGAPLLELETGDDDSSASYASGSGTPSLLFAYAVASGDWSPDLDYTGASALSLNGGSIRDMAGNDAVLDLPWPGSGLLDLGGIEVDGVAPRIANVTSPDDDDTYGTGATVNITVGFTEPVTFVPAGARPVLPLDTGAGTGRQATCEPAGGDTASAELACAYEVRRGDATSDLGYGAGTQLGLGGAAVRDRVGNEMPSPALLPDSPPAATLSGSKAIALDTAVPEVLRVTSPDANGTYGRGDVVRIHVVFNGTVHVDPEPSAGEESVPALHLETGENNRAALYAGGSGTGTLEFSYTVIAGDHAPDLNYTGTGALSLGHRELVDEYGNSEESTVLPGPSTAGSLGSQKDIAVRTVPTVEGVGANYTAGASLKVGQTVGVRVQFSEKVNVEPAANGGLPYIELDTGRAGGAARAAYSTGAGGHALVFAYPVHHLDSKDALDYAGAGALKRNGASIRGAGADANLALPGPASGDSLAAAGIELRPNEAPSITRPANRTHGAGNELREGITAADPERQPLAFSLIDPVPAGASINATTGVLTWTPTAAQRTAGGADNMTYVITVRVTDPYMASDTARFAVTVIETQPAGYTGPTIAAIPDAEGREGEEIRLDIAVAAGGHGPFVYSLVVDVVPPPPRGAIVHPNGTFSWTPGYDQNGTHPITAKAADRFGLAATRSFTVSVLDAEPPWNAPPAIEAIGPLSADEGERLVVRVSADDPDLPIVYSLSGDPPARASIDSATGVFTWDIWYDQAGTHNITVSAADRYGQASLLSFTVAVADVEPLDLPPSIDPIPPQRVTAGTALSLQVNATDPNRGDTVTFGLDDPPPGAAITAGGLLAWTPGRGQVGQHVLNVTATDGGGLSASALLSVTVVDPRAVAAQAAAEAVFAGPGTVRIDYTAPLGPPAGHEGDVYGAVSIEGGGSSEPASVSGLGTRTHIVGLDGDGAGLGQNGTIRLLADLEGTAGGVLYTFAADSIPVRAGAEARTLSPPGATAPVVAIERDGFVRAVNATAAGDGARPAINVTGLAAGAEGGAGVQGAFTMPNGTVSIIASFASVSFPPNAVASPVPADGLLELYVSPHPPTAREVADALGADAADIEVLAVVEVGDNETSIAFKWPVRILLAGQANARAFYVNATSGEVARITASCGADDTDAVHAGLGGSGECHIDSGGDKIIYTYHLTLFGTARVPAGAGGMCSATLAAADIEFGRLAAGAQSDAMDQEIRSAGTLPLDRVSISAAPWMGPAGVAMPANATSVMVGSSGEWTPLEGAVEAAPEVAGQPVPAKFRLQVPPGALPPASAADAVRVSQVVTYTVTCAAGP